MSDQLSRANITVYDPALPGTRVLRVTTGNGFMTRPTDVPANTYYLSVLDQPADISRHMFSPGTTSGRSKVALGDVVLLNEDGALDAWRSYAFDGRPITIEDGTVAGGFTTSLVATMDGVPEFGARTVTIRLRDRQAELDTPLQTNRYAGNNALPAGLEGVATDLKGKPKPFLLGVGTNIPAPSVNSAKLVHQIHDGALASVEGVYDRGIALVPGRTWGATVSVFGASVINRVRYLNAALFIACADSGKLATSPDGLSWTLQADALAKFGGASIQDAAFGAGLYVAVSSAGEICSSPDGITWTVRYTSASQFRAVTFDATLSLFAACGFSGLMVTSPDGITWTVQAGAASASGGNELRDIACNGLGVFVAVGQNATIISSQDGITWTARANAVNNSYWRRVAYGGGQWLAGGWALARSPDGYNWTVAANPIPPAGQQIYGMLYGPAGWTVGGTSGYHSTSADGTTWVTYQITAFGITGTDVQYGLAHGAGLYVLGTAAGATFATASGSYANTADMLNDQLAPAAGEFIACLSGGYVRLGSPPAGLVTCDATEGATLADRTAAQLFKRALLKAGKTGADYLAADLVALDAANSAVCGVWVYGDATTSAVLDQIAGSVWAWWVPDRNGVYRIKQFTAPAGASTFTFDANDLRNTLEVLGSEDIGKGVPSYRTVLRYARNYAVQTNDLAAGVSSARRAVVGEEWRATQYETAGVKTAHLLSPEIVEDTLLVDAAAALTEATRRQGIRSVKRGRFPLQVELTAANAAIDIGAVGTLRHARFGLAAGQLVTVLSVEPNKKRGDVMLTVWG